MLFTGRLYAQLKGKGRRGYSGTRRQDRCGRSGAGGLCTRQRGSFSTRKRADGCWRSRPHIFFAWADAVRNAGGRAGVYCSAINVPDGNSTISTARDIVERENALARNSAKGKGAEHQRLRLWIANDQCPPSPGCARTHPALTAASSGCACEFDCGMAICAVASARSVHGRVPGELCAGWQVLRSRIDRRARTALST